MESSIDARVYSLSTDCKFDSINEIRFKICIRYPNKEVESSKVAMYI
jgi:hypothetical protein